MTSTSTMINYITDRSLSMIEYITNRSLSLIEVDFAIFAIFLKCYYIFNYYFYKHNYPK